MQILWNLSGRFIHGEYIDHRIRSGKFTLPVIFSLSKPLWQAPSGVLIEGTTLLHSEVLQEGLFIWTGEWHNRESIVPLLQSLETSPRYRHAHYHAFATNPFNQSI